MASFWDQVNQLFRKAETSSASQPAVHELIVRDAAAVASYERWKQSLVMRRMLSWLCDQFAIYQLEPERIDESLDFLYTPSTKGLVIHFYKTNYHRQEITHFLDYLKERVLTLNYKTQLSDYRTYNKGHWVETMERHYLKPRPQFDEAGKMNQQFGNILIELEIRDEQAYQLRLRATTYQDYNYLPPADFKELMQVVLAS